jgi:transcription antitermination protein NusB
MKTETHGARSAARLFAVQALYQMDIGQTPLETVIREFAAHRLDISQDEVELPEADRDYFERIVRGVVKHQEKLDIKVNEFLSDNWRLGRIDSTLRAILRCGAYELVYNQDVPKKVIVSQYADLAHSFFDGPEGGMANAMLDRFGKAVSSGEILPTE